MLLLVAWILRIEGWTILILGLVFSVAFAVMVPSALGGGPGGILGGPLGTVLTFLLAAGAVLWFAVPILAGAEIIFVLLQIEKNTRDTADVLRRRD